MQFTRVEPPEELSHLVECYWIVNSSDSTSLTINNSCRFPGNNFPFWYPFQMSMKPVLISLLMLIVIDCSSQSTSEATKKFAKLEWLVGTWNRTNVSKPGKSSHERWEKVTEHELRGYGVTLQGTDTTFLEKITILIKDNNIFYVADVPENTQPVYFKFVEITESGFVCENPEHDFPKVISYQLKDGNLKAQISGNGKSIDYLFKKQ